MWQHIWQCWKHFCLYQLKACTEEIEAGVALTTLSCTYGPSNKERGQFKPWELLRYINIPTNRLSLSLLHVTLLYLSFFSLRTIDTNKKCHIHWVIGFRMWPQLCFILSSHWSTLSTTWMHPPLETSQELTTKGWEELSNKIQMCYQICMSENW